MNRTEQNVMTHAQPLIEEMGYKLIEVEYVKEGPDYYLRLYLDKKGGITLEDCARASEALSEKLDEWEIIEGGYFLDVSSPGAERPINDDDDLEMTLDQGIYVKTYQQIEGNKEWTGILKHYDADAVTIEYKDKTRTKSVVVSRDKIATIRKAVIL
ncbi:ribosome maturation factor RimP [Salinicoccus sesuvii]|uniref:Ribosome maturation factor RimP n=1 Tax=Salinicoccus sesuvii TaxID=868281 RepID=A0ABV7N5D7_9STAP